MTSELLASHRAVAPSLGIDLIPIVRHCLSARKAQLLRDVLLTVLLIAGLFLATAPIIAILVISFCLSFLPGVQWERRSLGIKVLAGLGAAVVIGAIAVFYLVGTYFNAANGGAAPSFGPLATGFTTLMVVLVFLVLIGTVLVGYSYSMYRTFSDRLRPGALAGQFDPAPAEVEERIAQVAAAQRGNMTIYGGDNPFIGTGPRLLNEDWSIAIELDRAPGPGRSGSRPAHRSGSYVPIDPVELHHVIRTRLLKVKDDGLPANERITALSMHDHVVGDGNCRWDSPVIDQARTTPYSQASPEAIDALIRHPAAGLRYYLRVCVSDEGQPVWTRSREVIGSTDQEIAVSAFVYVAVEGRMFYLQFVPTILPPIYQAYHLIDRLPKVSSSEFMVKVVLHAARTSFRDLVRAPFGAIGSVARGISERRAYRSEIKSASDYLFADMGARISVRESGGSAAGRNFIQVLDTVKYTRIVQRLVLDTGPRLPDRKRRRHQHLPGERERHHHQQLHDPRQRGCHGDRKPWPGGRARSGTVGRPGRSETISLREAGRWTRRRDEKGHQWISGTDTRTPKADRRSATNFISAATSEQSPPDSTVRPRETSTVPRTATLWR